MATSSDFDAVYQTLTAFSSATTPPTVASSQEITKFVQAPDRVSANDAIGSQFLSFVFEATASTDTGTFVVFMADLDSVGSLGCGKFRQVTLTVTATTTRTSHSTAAGGFVCTVVSSEPPLRNTMDLFGLAKNTRVFIGCTVISGGPFTCRVAAGRAI